MTATCFLVGPDEASQVDMEKEPNTRGCDLCAEPIGVVERDSPTGGDRLGWVVFYEVMVPFDTAPTRFCAPCFSWLGEAKSVF